MCDSVWTGSLSNIETAKKERCLLEECHLPNFEPDTAIVMIRTTSPATILSSTEGAYFRMERGEVTGGERIVMET